MENLLKRWCHLDFLAGKAAPGYNPYCLGERKSKGKGKSRKKEKAVINSLEGWFLTSCIKRILKIFTYFQNEKYTAPQCQRAGYFMIILNRFCNLEAGSCAKQLQLPICRLEWRKPICQSSCSSIPGPWPVAAIPGVLVRGRLQHAGLRFYGPIVTYGW